MSAKHYSRPMMATLALLAAGAIALLFITPANVSEAKAQPPQMAAAVPVVATAAISQVSSSTMTWTDLHDLAVAADASAYSIACRTNSVGFQGTVIAVSGVVTSTGVAVPAGRKLTSPRLKDGVVMTLESVDVWQDNDFVRETLSHELIVIGGNNISLPGNVAACAVGCSVTCGDGYYACCNEGWISDTCKCVKNGTTPAPDCDHGGPGATGCSTQASD